MADERRPVEPAEAWALGTLHGILLNAGLKISPVNPTGHDVNDRSFDVVGLTPTMKVGNTGFPATIRITVEEVT
jgi:hypothetical protein